MNTIVAIRQNVPDDLKDLRAELAGHIREAAKIAQQIAITETVQMFITEADGADAAAKNGADAGAKGSGR